VSRVIEWLRRQPVEAWVTAGVVTVATVFVFLQLNPGLLFLDTTPAGGDMGAHVWGPAYLREELLPRLRLSGWTPDWYAGFPAYHFYMVVPSLFIVVLDVVLFVPYNVAFKLVSVAGLIALPIAGWAMGKLARLPFPTPLAFAVATVPFIFDRSFSIYGGNAASTLAGEFAFTISLVFALLFLGVVFRGVQTGKSRWVAAVLLGLTVTCHLIPAIFALLGAGVAVLVHLDWTRRALGIFAGVLVVLAGIAAVAGLGALVVLLVVAGLAAGAYLARNWKDRDELRARLGANRLRVWWLVSAGGVGTLLTMFWTLPFYAQRGFMTDMGWEKVTNYQELLFPGRLGRLFHTVSAAPPPGDLTLVAVLAFLGAIASFVFRRRFGVWLTLVAVVVAAAVIVTPQGRLWNARLLPFWYLCLYLLAAVAIVEVIAAIAVLIAKTPDTPRRGALLGGPILATLLVLLVVAFPLRALPLGSLSGDGRTYRWLGLSSTDHSYIPDWVRWNYSGYERKAAYPEYQEVVSAMRDVGQQRGCGRAMWEYDKSLDRFGTPMALMLLPYWTEGCIGSMEGLYFEASATTPYHFINQTELSAAPSQAERGLPYGQLDIGLGVDHLQLLGVRYYMAFSEAAIAQAEAETDLELVGSAQQWRVYEVAHAELVQPLHNQPAVLKDAPTTGKGWEKLAVDWYLDRSKWGVLRATDGPATWQRVAPGEDPLIKEISETTVSDLQVTPDQIKFTVDRTGAPMLIKASYFPNWKVDNAEGPFRVAPNLMVVVPLDNIVTLRYERTGVDWFSLLLTAAGIGLAIQLGRQRRLRIPPPSSWARRAPAPPPPPPTPEDVLATVGGGGTDRERWGPPPT
jgi:uncharacterized membrane protein